MVRVAGYRSACTYDRDGQTHTVKQILGTGLAPFKIKAPRPSEPRARSGRPFLLPAPGP